MDALPRESVEPGNLGWAARERVEHCEREVAASELLVIAAVAATNEIRDAHETPVG